jgi:hypothetical protein
MRRHARCLGLSSLLLSLLASPAVAETTVGTLALDGLSFVSFQDLEVLAIPSGSTLRFHFGAPGSDGSVPFTLAPEDVAIAPIPMPSGGGTLRYALAGPASGWIRPTPTGRRIDFTANVAASLETADGGGTFTYRVPFTTESTEASNAPGTVTIEAQGMRLVEGVWYVQLVGATTNHTNAFPKPGAAVYTVLSGRFDQLP